MNEIKKQLLTDKLLIGLGVVGLGFGVYGFSCKSNYYNNLSPEVRRVYELTSLINHYSLDSYVKNKEIREKIDEMIVEYDALTTNQEIRVQSEKAKIKNRDYTNCSLFLTILGLGLTIGMIGSYRERKLEDEVASLKAIID